MGDLPPTPQPLAAAVPWAAVWRAVARRLAEHRAAGRGHLLTEDVVRMETVLALEDVGVPASRMVAEYLAPQLVGGKLDLVLDPPAGAVIEFKYPRDSRTGISPDTMTLGELVRDFLRVATVQAQERWVVQVLNPRLARYLAGVQHRHLLRWATTEGGVLQLDPAVLEALPPTALTAIGRALLAEPVTAHCVVAVAIDEGLVLYAYAVEAPVLIAPDEAPQLVPPATSPPYVAQRAASAREPRGARAQILTAVRAITTRSGRPTFTLAEVVNELRGSRYAESTIRTMVSSHLCAQAQGPGIDSHSDLDRVGRGVYRLR